VAADLLAPLVQAPRRAAVLLDVDGTLAPIVARPELARVPESTRAELRRLAGRYRLVACLSGRSGPDARALIGVEGVVVVGNHGLELDPRAAGLEAAVGDFRREIARPVEDKGLSLTYHYRGARDEPRAIAELEGVAAKAHAAGLVARWGRKVLEIRPPVDADKGTAVKSLLGTSGATRALYAGDDTTDLDAFAGLVEASLETAIRIAVDSPEAPPELLAAADLIVEGPAELVALLGRL
jgi:trehalose 6-phosphate phosphatase